MDDEYLKEQAARVRNMACFADPFTKKRLLDLAEKYDNRTSPPRHTPLPTVTPTTSPVKPNGSGGNAA